MKNKIDLENIEKIKLPTLYNMRPGKYIFILLIILLTIASFILFVLPGLYNSGTYVTFTSEYTNVGVLLDGKYVGSTENNTIYLEDGTYEAEYIKESEVISKDTITIKKSVFFTLFNKPTQEVSLIITPSEDILNLSYNRTISDLVISSQIIDEEFTPSPIITYFALDAVASNVKDVKDEILTITSFITTQALLEDLNNALSILDNNNISYTCDSFTSLYNSLLNEKEVKLQDNTVLATNYINNVKFEAIDYQLDDNVNISLDSFKVMKNLVTEYEYSQFLLDNPKWNLENKEELIKNNLVDSAYLDTVYIGTSYNTNRPIVNISYNAALAYIDYINEKNNRNFRLLNESEAEIFIANGANLNKYFLTDSTYVPNKNHNKEIYELCENLTNTNMIIKGTPALGVKYYEKGLIAKDTCSEFVSFVLTEDING